MNSPAATQPPSESNPSPQGPPPHKWRRRMRRFGISAAIVLVVLVVMGVVTEHYTSQPRFCGSCHIMDPYYTSWKRDVHEGDTNARCVDCHYAPGEQHTLRAKFRGLSQVTSYFSGRAGAGRPKAHVNDASCLTSGCHADRKYMTNEEKLGNVVFVHAKHLDPQSENLVKARKKLADLRAKLAERVGAARLGEIETIAQAIGEATRRDQELADWLSARSLSDLREDVVAYAESLHVDARISQLGNLHCASCHQFDVSLQKHFALAKTTCYTCHFINQPFNATTGKCLSCHHPPAGPVPIHYGELATTRRAAASVPTSQITMDHATILANNVNCVSCHADLIHGNGDVTRRDCQNCHDQARYLKDFDHLTVEVVRDYHRVHAGGQYARCNDCHHLIDHKLVPLVAPGEAEALLAPVRRDCQHCHPSHHREQVEMLLGQGGYAGAATGLPNPMTGSRANCEACHTQPGADPKGEKVVRSTVAACRGCHGKDYEELFTRWREEIRARLSDAKILLAQVQEQLSVTTQPGGPGRVEATRLIARARQNIQLVATANGIHNRNYALLLLDQAVHDLQTARDKIGSETK